jgi:cephalosporin-C deacetylase-like acetyl esterase
MKKAFFALLFIFAFSFVSSSQDSYQQFVKRFDYDQKTPLDTQEKLVAIKDGARIYDVSYASLKGGRVPAYLVVPEKKGKYAAILFGHWAMKGSPMRNRMEFLDEAVVLAKAGVVSLLPDAPFARPEFVQDTEFFGEATANAFMQHLLDMRRGVDLLAARKDVDAKRIGYVGHSYNANAGGVLTGIEKRIKAFVLMAGGLSDTADGLSNEPEAIEMRKAVGGDEKARELLTKYSWGDPANYVSRAAPSAVFLQYAKNDGLLSRRAQYYFSLVSEPKEMKIYDAGHALNAEARRDRYEFLRKHLNLKRIDTTALDKIKELK